MMRALLFALSACCAGALLAAPPHAAGGRNRALEVPLAWDLQLSNGLAAQVRSLPDQAGAVQAGTSTWTRNGAPFGEPRKIEFFTDRAGLVAHVARTEAEDNAASAALQDTPDDDALAAQYNALLDEISARCGQLPENSQAACTRPYDKKVEAFNARMGASRDARERRAKTLAAVCTRLVLQVSGSTVTGVAQECPGGKDARVTGSFRPAHG